ncbi:hypothetical protein ACQP1V_38690 [Microtetraspora malaysiensis]|uniref:hypothetical protein n=1 Tax=Microtetraspora malaysiensis TaxID=161358 RepID=UPI003D912A25
MFYYAVLCPSRKGANRDARTGRPYGYGDLMVRQGRQRRAGAESSTWRDGDGGGVELDDAMAWHGRSGKGELNASAW